MRTNNYEGALQQPINSGFTATTTAAAVISGHNLSGKTAIITGGGTGIGLETAKTLAKAGAQVIVAVRDYDKAAANLHGITNIEIESLDCMNPASIDAFALKFLESQRPLHWLINNAGIMWVPFRQDSRGYESQWATNYLAQYHLTARLFPSLQKANGARVINVSSLGHQMSPVNLNDPNFKSTPYETLQAYGRSKSASNLFTVELNNRAKKYNVLAFSLHPGSIGGTELAREATFEQFQQMGFCDAQGNILPEIAAKLKSIPQGAATTVWCAVSPLLENYGGVYCEDCNIASLLGHNPAATIGVNGVEPYSLNEDLAWQLWNLSEKMTGVAFLNN